MKIFFAALIFIILALRGPALAEDKYNGYIRPAESSSRSPLSVIKEWFENAFGMKKTVISPYIKPVE